VTQQLDEKTLIAYEHQFKQGFKCGVFYNRNQQLVKNLEFVYCFHVLSNLLNATAIAILRSEDNLKLEEKFMS
jgi:hypothetical protein